MKLTFVSSLLFGAIISLATAHEGHHPHDHPHGDVHHHHGHGRNHDGSHHGHHHDHHHTSHTSHTAHDAEEGQQRMSYMSFHKLALDDVTEACSLDVETLCADDPMSSMMGSLSLLDATAASSPFSSSNTVEWVLMPQQSSLPPPEEATELMEHVLDAFFSTPPSQFMSVLVIEETMEETQAVPHFVADSMAAKLASHHQDQPDEIPELVQALRMHGSELMGHHEPDSFHHHMARRLSELDTTTVQHYVHLPFGCPKNRCLREAIAHHQTSEACANRVARLETVYAMEARNEEQVESMMQDLLGLYLRLLLCVALFVRGAARKSSYYSARTLQVVKTVYSNKAIKRDVENELGASIGNDLPMSPCLNEMISDDPSASTLRERLTCLARIRTVHFCFLTTLALYSPYLFWLVIGSMLIAKCMVRVVWRFFDDADCTCCCCGLSASDAAAEDLTSDQACCNCCKGTGKCSAACAACCGTCCCCGGSDCCCCNSSDDVKLDADCTCCCCGATMAGAAAGTLTSDQMCCNCCKGTGKCSAACAACCGTCCCCCGGSGCCCCGSSECCCCSSSAPSKNSTGTQTTSFKGKGQKHRVAANQAVVYEGIPVQIV